MRDGLGDGYTEALRLAWKKFKPNSWDFVMYWWHQSAELVRDGKVEQFGLITTNSIHQTFNRRCIEPFLANDKKPISITYAIPDHPWVDSADGAAVRIAMTVCVSGQTEGSFQEIISETENLEGESNVNLRSKNGKINSKCEIGVDLASSKTLQANENISNRGFCLFGSGFIVSEELAIELQKSSIPNVASIIHDYRNGKDIANRPRGVKVIDAYGLTQKDFSHQHPAIYQHVFNTVKPERDNNKRESRKKYWWIFGEPNKKLRDQRTKLKRFIATGETSKHRVFTFLDISILPDNALVNFAIDSAITFSCLSSSLHVIWALSNGGRLEDRPVYNKSRCFETFPFPDITDPALKKRLTELGERLDSHRKARQAEHPELTLTGMYNVLEKIRAEEPLNDKEKVIHDQGLVTLLKQIHDDIDAATYEAYGWSDIWQWHQDCLSGTCYDPEDGTICQLELGPETSIHEATAEYREKYDQVLLHRLVDLNHLRAAEEAKGKIRYLRPDYQDPENTQDTQQEKTRELALPAADIAKDITASKVKAKTAKLKWPKELPKHCLLYTSPSPRDRG